MAYKKIKAAPGTWFERDMFLSRAYWSLKGAAPQLLTYFLSKRQKARVTDKKGTKYVDWVNLDSITVTYKELENLFSEPGTKKKDGITQPRITRSIDELLGKGFIEIRNPGGAYQQDKAVYALIDKWTFWRPGTVFSKRKKDVHRGYQGKKQGKARL